MGAWLQQQRRSIGLLVRLRRRERQLGQGLVKWQEGVVLPAFPNGVSWRRSIDSRSGREQWLWWRRQVWNRQRRNRSYHRHHSVRFFGEQAVIWFPRERALNAHLPF